MESRPNSGPPQAPRTPEGSRRDSTDRARPVSPASDALSWRLEAMGDSCLIVEFGQRVDAEINRRARAVADHLLAHPIAGVVDVVPAFTSVAVFYRPEAFWEGLSGEAPHVRLRREIEAILARGVEL